MASGRKRHNITTCFSFVLYIAPFSPLLCFFFRKNVTFLSFRNPIGAASVGALLRVVCMTTGAEEQKKETLKKTGIVVDIIQKSYHTCVLE